MPKSSIDFFLQTHLFLIPTTTLSLSGFIQHPPQRPFEKPLQVQPPTLSVSLRKARVFFFIFGSVVNR